MLRQSLILSAAIVGSFVSSSVFGATITQWDFNSPTPDSNTSTGTTSPAIGSGTASLIGGTTATFASGDASGGSSDPATGDDSAWNITTWAAQSTGDKSRGVQFAVSTVGYDNITITFDQRHSNTVAREFVVQYTTDGSTFTDIATFTATAGDTWFNNRSVDLTAISAVNNNANFAFRIVASFTGEPGSAYDASTPSSTYGTSGTARFDMVTVSGAVIPEPATLGLLGLASLIGLRRRSR